MFIRYICLLIFLISFSNTAFAKNKSQYVPGKRWVRYIQKSSINDLCNKKSVFRRCYKTGKINCKISMKRYLKACEKQVYIPKRLLPSTEGIPLLARIGSCAGKKYNKKYSRQYKKRKGCV